MRRIDHPNQNHQRKCETFKIGHSRGMWKRLIHIFGTMQRDTCEIRRQQHALGIIEKATPLTLADHTRSRELQCWTTIRRKLQTMALPETHDLARPLRPRWFCSKQRLLTGKKVCAQLVEFSTSLVSGAGFLHG